MHAERHMQTHARAVTYIYLVALHAWLQVPQLAHQKCMMRHHAAKHVMAHCSPACMQTNMHVYISNWLGMHCMASCKQSCRFTHISVYVLTWSVYSHLSVFSCMHIYAFAPIYTYMGEGETDMHADWYAGRDTVAHVFVLSCCSYVRHAGTWIPVP